MTAPKSMSDVTIELVKVRELLATLRKESGEDNTEMLYGAQQALAWMLNEGDPPSRLWAIIEEIAEDM